MKRIVLVILFILLFFVSVCQAEGMRLWLELGYFMPSAESVNYNEYDYNMLSGADIGGKLAYYFNNYFGFNFGIRQYGSGKNGDSTSSWSDNNDDQMEYSVITYAAGLSLRYPLDPIECFIDGGLTYNNNKIILYGRNSDNELKGSASGYFVDTGIRIAQDKGWLMGFTVRYASNDQKYKNHSDLKLGGFTILYDVGFAYK
ncbi:MAG: porin family protein [Deferribacteraceae bacterium]|nr:porin family protein [Deferribacteraceae bacterium]